MRFTEREEAVSPVIGVILMVAITVILATVIGVFVFGMAGDIQGAKIVQITGTINSTDGTINYVIMGGPSLNELNSVSYKIGSADAVKIFGSGAIAIEVGAVNSTATTITDGDRVLLVGTFGDGTEQILLDKTY